MKQKKQHKNQNPTEEHLGGIKQKQFDYEWVLGKPFLGINFTDTQKTVIEKLGCPDWKYKDMDSYIDSMYSITYYYDNDNIRIIFHYENDKYDDTSIFVLKFCINKKNLFSLKKKGILKLLSKYSNIVPEEALDKNDVYIENDILYEYYFFKDINLTLWFENECLDEVCIGPSFDDLE